MPRKRSIAGRRKNAPTLITLVNQANKQLRKLERSREYGKYASKELIRTAKESPKLNYSRKGYKKITISKRARIKPIEQRAMAKQLMVVLKRKE